MMEYSFKEADYIRSEAIRLLWDNGRILSTYWFGGEIRQAISLHPPDAQTAMYNVIPIRNWRHRLSEYESQIGSGFLIEYKSRRILGDIRPVPQRAVISSLNAAIKVTNKKLELSVILELLNQAVSLFPDSLEKLKLLFVRKHSLILEEYRQGNWDKAITVAKWLCDNPLPLVSMRSVSITGIDSKFIEHNKQLISFVLESVLPEDAIDFTVPAGASRFEERYGFARNAKDVLVKMTASDFQKSAFASDRVLVVENQDFLLSSSPLPNGITVIYGGGYGFTNLASSDSLSGKQIYYWGDLDTNGFKILSDFRKYYPETISVMMDKDTFEKYYDGCVRETSPIKNTPPNLTNDECDTFMFLLSQMDENGATPRLEQEHIPAEWRDAQIKKICI